MELTRKPDQTIVATGLNLINEPHDPNAAYKEGDVPKNAANEWEYLAVEDVPADQNIQITNSNYWKKAFTTESDRYKDSVGRASVINPIYGPHDPNAAYSKGDYLVSLHCIAIQAVSKNSNISWSDERYWTTTKGSNTPPEGYEASNKNKNYLVGCAGIIVNPDNEFLVGLRLDMNGEEVWALFGGKPEAYETLAEGLAREVVEEVNIDVLVAKYLFIAMKEALASKTQRCVTAYFATKITAEQVRRVRNLEPHKCFKLEWKTYAQLCELNLWQNSIEECRIVHELLCQGKFDG